jgi:hypothetical protein
MTKELKVGDAVEVLDEGLRRLRAIMPDMPPNHHGFVMELNYGDSGDILVVFPIGDDPIEEHSQVAPYPPHLVRKRETGWN